MLSLFNRSHKSTALSTILSRNIFFLPSAPTPMRSAICLIVLCSRSHRSSLTCCIRVSSMLVYWACISLITSVVASTLKSPACGSGRNPTLNPNLFLISSTDGYSFLLNNAPSWNACALINVGYSRKNSPTMLLNSISWVLIHCFNSKNCAIGISLCPLSLQGNVMV